MAVAYSAKSLSAKLGIVPGTRMAILGAPFDYLEMLGPLQDQVEIVRTLEPSSPFHGELGFIHFFTTEYADLVNQFPLLKQALDKRGALWISWPKRRSRLTTDLNEQVVRETGLENGLVDVKIAAINQDWSALKFVYRLKDR